MIANEFGEAAYDPLHRAALIAAGLVLFVLTLVVNAIARAIVSAPSAGSARAPPRWPAAASAAAVGSMSSRCRPSRRAAGAPTSLRAAARRWRPLVALVPLVLVLYYLLKQGLGAISWTSSPPTRPAKFFGDPGGIKSAIIGTIDDRRAGDRRSPIPIGIGVALYLVEYGRGVEASPRRALLHRRDDGRAVDRLRPVRLHHARRRRRRRLRFAGWKGAVALALLMLPVVTRSAEVVLQLVPDSLREAALALGAPRWRVVAARRAADGAARASSPASLLAVARAAGETAPLLFTAAIVNGTNFDLGEPHELAADADIQRRRPGTGPPASERPGARR